MNNILDYNEHDLFNVRFYDEAGRMMDFLSDYVSYISFDTIRGDIIVNFIEIGIAYVIKNKYLKEKHIADYENKLKTIFKHIKNITIEYFDRQGNKTQDRIFTNSDVNIQLSTYKFYWHFNEFKINTYNVDSTSK